MRFSERFGTLRERQEPFSEWSCSVTRERCSFKVTFILIYPCYCFCWIVSNEYHSNKSSFVSKSQRFTFCCGFSFAKISTERTRVFRFRFRFRFRFFIGAVFVGAFPGALPPLIGWVACTGSILGVSNSGELQIMGLILFGIQFIWQFAKWIIMLLKLMSLRC